MKALLKIGTLHIITVIMHCQSYFGVFSFNLMLLQLKFKQTNEFNKQDVIVEHASPLGGGHTVKIKVTRWSMAISSESA